MMIPSIPNIAAGLFGLGALTPSRQGAKASMGAIPDGAAPANSFAGELAGAMARVESSAKASGELRNQLLRGENVELHTVAIQAQEAQVSFELLLQVRNKLIQGYQEIMRMQI